MDNMLCDELVQEIMQHLPPSSSSSTSLVCKRWLHLYRTCKTSISLRITPNNIYIPSLSSFLTLYPALSSLTLVSDSNEHPIFISNNLLICIASTCSNLRHLRFLVGPVSFSALLSLSSSCKHLTSLTISSSLPLSFSWLTSFPSLKILCFTKFQNRVETGEFEFEFDGEGEFGLEFDEEYEVGVSSVSHKSSELPLECLSVSGLGVGDCGLGWLWRSCTKLKRLELRSCEGFGDGNSFTSFIKCLKALQELEIRTCRTIVDRILLLLAEHCSSLNSLLLYDGGSREGLHQFISRSRSNIQKLDLRLPLDLENNHLLAVAKNFRGLISLRLQSCCLVTGEGLKTIGSTVSVALEELALINCDVVEREPGLLTTLGQNLKGLKKLDLSYNEMLVDMEFVSMVVSCKNLTDIKLRGCKKLTNFAVVSMYKSSKFLENVDIMHCSTIGDEGVEVFILNSKRLRRIQVEESKVTDTAKNWASEKFIEMVT